MKPIEMMEVLTENGLSGTFPTDGDSTCSWASFDRRDGVGKAPYDSRNVSYHVGDQRELVKTNRQSIQQALDCKHLVSVHQVHGTEIYCLTDPPAEDIEPAGYDALLTDLVDVGLLIQQADCQAVLLHDPEHHAIGAVHCGWRGSVEGIIGLSISRMVEVYGTLPELLNAVVSPSLGPCCAEFIHHEKELPAEFSAFSDGSNHFDFWQISRNQLLDSGVKDTAIQIAGICTACNTDYFSYRRSRKNGETQTGRNCSVIVQHSRQEGSR